MDFLYIVIGLFLLIFGGNWLLKAAVGISLKLHIPKAVIGMTVVSFATSAPELIVSVKATLDGATGLAVGNVIGSNIANLGLVLAVTVILSKITVSKRFYTINWAIMMLASILLYVFIAFDKTIQREEGIVLFLLLIGFLIYMLKFQKPTVENENSKEKKILPLYKIGLLLILGGFGLWLGSELLIKGSVSLAKSLGVSDAVIGVTIVSVGTSIPELTASVIAVFHKEKAISLGNLIGSNIFNILAVLGITAIITPIEVQPSAMSLITEDIYWMLGISFVLLPLVFIPKKLTLGWKEGLFLLFAYTFFIFMVIR